MEENIESSIRLRDLWDRRDLIVQLAYPSQEIEYASSILRELESLQVDSIFIVKDTKTSLKLLGKGYRGIVLKASYNDTISTVKILRTDSSVSSMYREAEMMMLANSKNIGPKIYAFSKHVILMEYIDGVSFDAWLDNLDENDEGSLRRILKTILEQARRLDEINLDHGELSNPRRHVMIRKTGSAVILDFGKASLTSKPKNVTSLFSYISHGKHHRKIMRMLHLVDIPRHVIREYKENPTRERFEEIIKILNLLDR
ncbi:MAG: RIO1 family regulatory kinase/ATPase [Candidatus Caldarchaeales archaeon]